MSCHRPHQGQGLGGQEVTPSRGFPLPSLGTWATHIRHHIKLLPCFHQYYTHHFRTQGKIQTLNGESQLTWPVKLLTPSPALIFGGSLLVKMPSSQELQVSTQGQH